MKILLFGKNGQLGWELQRSLQVLGEIIALDASDSLVCGDFYNPQGLAATVAKIRPAVVVNAAAYTAVDKAESEPERARTVNAVAVGTLAAAASAVGAWMIHFSTDYVFDGSGAEPWHEDSPTAPLNVYGTTKREGEQLVTLACARHLILRTSWVYGVRGNNFAKTMLGFAISRSRIQVVNDQWGAPTGADLLADVVAHAVRRIAEGRAAPAGTYHITAGGETTWHEYARLVIESARARGAPILVPAEEVVAVASSAFITAARRPANSRLDTEKFRRVFGLHLPPWQQGVQRLLSETFVP